MAEKIDITQILNEKFASEKIKSLRFEDGLKLVEELVSRVETGQLSLDNALLAYERGSLLVDHLRTLLEGAEAKLQVLNEKRNK